MTRMRAIMLGFIPALALLLMAQTSPPSLRLANPTGTVTLSTTNGAATTAMRSDAAPALSQSIAPTWTGQHTFDGGVKETACSLTVASGTLNDLDVFSACSPSGAHAVLRITPDASADSTITGIVLASNQRVFVVIGDPGTGIRGITLNTENVNSTATNRLILSSQANQCVVNRGDSFVLWKDPTSDRVRVMNGEGYVCGA